MAVDGVFKRPAHTEPRITLQFAQNGSCLFEEVLDYLIKIAEQEVDYCGS